MLRIGVDQCAVNIEKNSLERHSGYLCAVASVCAIAK
jgi:hypothetical protein